MDEDDRNLTAEIVRSLEIDHQYAPTIERRDEHLVDQIRRCGRAAGRQLRYRVRTFATDTADDGRRRVWVVAIASNADEEARIRERGDLLIRDTLDRLLG